MENEKTLRKLTKVLKRFQEISPQMQVSTILTLLVVYEAKLKGEDLSTKDVEQKLGLLSGTSSRNIYYWADGATGITRAMNYITVAFDPSDRRQRVLRFTKEGEAFMKRIMEDLDARP